MKTPRWLVLAVVALPLATAKAQDTNDWYNAAQTLESAVAMPIPHLTPKVQVYRTDAGGLRLDWETLDQVRQDCSGCGSAVPYPGGQPVYFDNVRTYNRYLVADCASRANVGRRVRVQTESSELCRERPFILPNLKSGSDVGYDVWKEKDGPHIGVSLRLIVPDSVDGKRAHQMFLETFSRCGKLTELLGRYGIHFETQLLMSVAPNDSSMDSAYPEHRVKLDDNFGRSDSGHFYFRGQDSWRDCILAAAKGQPLPPGCGDGASDEFCATLAHETGHLLGLPDEYADPDCPDRKTLSSDENPWSLMDDDFMPWEQVELFPRHIATIMAPLCAGHDALISRRPRVFLEFHHE